MNRKLPNLSCVLRTSSKAKPWKVERRMGRVEHVFVSSRLLSSRESFYAVEVGRFKHQWQAENAAMKSAQRHGGFAKDANGGLWPNRPIRAKESSSTNQQIRSAPTLLDGGNDGGATNQKDEP